MFGPKGLLPIRCADHLIKSQYMTFHLMEKKGQPLQQKPRVVYLWQYKLGRWITVFGGNFCKVLSGYNSQCWITWMICPRESLLCPFHPIRSTSDTVPGWLGTDDAPSLTQGLSATFTCPFMSAPGESTEFSRLISGLKLARKLKKNPNNHFFLASLW